MNPSQDFSSVVIKNGSFSSDQRLKKNIKPLRDGVKFIKKIQPVSFFFRKGSATGPKLGFIAQQVKEACPDLDIVFVNPETDEMSLEYTGLIAPAYKAIQELADQVQILERTVAKQQAMIEILLGSPR
jgi:hypothetical protein